MHMIIGYIDGLNRYFHDFQDFNQVDCILISVRSVFRLFVE